MNLRTDAWLLRGMSSIPGELRLSAGTLSFVCSGTGSAWPFRLRKLARALRDPSLVNVLQEGPPAPLFQWPGAMNTRLMPPPPSSLVSVNDAPRADWSDSRTVSVIRER